MRSSCSAKVLSRRLLQDGCAHVDSVNPSMYKKYTTNSFTRSRSCRKAQEASRWSWSCWWSAPPPVSVLSLSLVMPSLSFVFSTNFDKYHPGYFGKVGMRHFHLMSTQLRDFSHPSLEDLFNFNCRPNCATLVTQAWKTYSILTVDPIVRL